MPRIKRAQITKKKHKKIKKLTKGFIKSRRASIKKGREALLKAGLHAYRDRRRKKRVMRNFAIIKINAACKTHDISYSKFINGLKRANIEIDRKILGELAQNHPKVFEEILKKSKRALKSI